MAKGEVVQEATGTQVALYDHAMFPELLSQDPAEVQARFTKRFQKAETLEDLFDVMEGTSSQDMVGKSIEVTSVQWAPYESDDGPVPLAICEAADLKTGEVIEFATTSGMMVLFIRKAQILGAIPFRAKITQKTTRSGRKALNFSRVGG